jgi:hypothetical protein
MELTDLSTVEEASTRLYGILQVAVDREIQRVGFMAAASTYGMKPFATNGDVGPRPAGARGAETRQNAHPNGNGHRRCSSKQRDFVERLVREKGLDKRERRSTISDVRVRSRAARSS